MRAFFKNGHNYKKDYGLKATTLGADIVQWWDEIRSTGNTANVYSGGPTGIYTIVVLMCWWCTLLKGHPDTELTDCLRILEEIDCAILMAVHNIENQPTKSPLDKPSPGMPAVPLPQARGTKRLVSEEPSSRKRLRHTKV